MLSHKVSGGGNCYAGLTFENGLGKYLLLERRNGRLEVGKKLSAKVGAENGVYGSLFSLLSDSGVRRDVPIAFSLPCNDALLRIIDMPGYTLREMRSAIRYQFGDHFPFAYDESRFDAAEIRFPGVRSDTTRFIAAVSRKRVIDEISLNAAGHGFALSRIEPAQLSFERAVTRDGEMGCVIKLYAGKRDFLFVISNFGDGIFYRNSVIKAEAGDYIDRAADEVRTSLGFAGSHIPNFSVNKIIIAGPNADEHLLEAVGNVLDIPPVEGSSIFAADDFTCATGVDSEMLLPLGAVLAQL